MSKTDLKTLIEIGNTDNNVLFTPDVSNHQVTNTLVAMANGNGGTILIGVSQGEVQHVANTTEVCNRIIETALAITPILLMNTPQVVTVDSKSCILVEVPKGLPNVYAYQGTYLQRDKDTNIPISPTKLRQLMLERADFSYESEVAYQSSLDDIDWVKAENYTKTLTGMGQFTAQEILHQRGCLTKYQGILVPTHAGILLFGKLPQQYIRGSEITAVRFAGEVMGDTFNRQDITGTLPEQIRRAETFLADHLRKSVQLKGTMKRQEGYEYPMEAVRELVVNAVAHRDYNIQGDNIRLYMYSDHLEVHSPGSLSGPMTVENLKEERFSRNPIIVQVLSDMGFIERLGYGVDRVIELMQSQEYIAPQFTNNPSGFKVVLSNQKQISKTDKLPQVNPTITVKKQEPVIELNGTFNGQAINSRQESAIIYLHQKSNSRITNSDLKKMFPDVHPETIRRDLVDLVNKKILNKMGQKRGSYYVLIRPDADDKP